MFVRSLLISKIDINICVQNMCNISKANIERHCENTATRREVSAVANGNGGTAAASSTVEVAGAENA